MNTGLSSALQGWIPYKLFFEDGGAFCHWLFVGDKEFTEPFFDETISKCREEKYGARAFKCISSIEVLPAWSGDVVTVQPAAFIFHVSRCGSTLASQQLSLISANIVLSEVPFFDELLRSGRKATLGDEDELTHLQLLKAAITFYAAKRKKIQEHLFIKTDSWHIFFYRQLRKLYPHTPFILLYRRPDEVIISQQKRRGMHAVPGFIEPELFGFNNNAIYDISLDEYMAKVLEKYFITFLEVLKKDPFAFPVNYNEGAIAIVKNIAGASGVFINENDLYRMKYRANFHGKYPGEFFSEEPIQTAIPSYCKQAFELYEEVEKIRTSLASQVEV